ncbi:unnamed protein product [Cochlearia groenlandica]
MPKKNSNNTCSLKKPSQEVEKSTIPKQQTKPAPKPGKLGKEIDDIFAGRKKKKIELEIHETKAEIVKKKMKRKRNELDDGFSNNNNNNYTRTRPRKRTEDGLLVFTESELCVNKANAGFTPLCPFDCNCCF